MNIAEVEPLGRLFDVDAEYHICSIVQMSISDSPYTVLGWKYVRRESLERIYG